jgi:ATP/ADP translocase
VTRRGFGQALSQPYVRLLLGVASAAAIVGVLIEFLFYQAASSSLGHGNHARLFADIYLALNLTALVVQRFVVPRLQTAIGLTGVLLVLPGAVVGVMPFAMLTPSTLLQGVLRLTEGGLKSSIYRVGWEQTYLPIMGRCRAEAKLLVDGVATRMAEGLVAVLLYAWARYAPQAGAARASTDLMLLLGVMAILWIALVVRTQRHLDQAPSPLADDQEAYTVRVPDS